MSVRYVYAAAYSVFLSITELPISSMCVALGTIGTILKGTLKSSEIH